MPGRDLVCPKCKKVHDCSDLSPGTVLKCGGCGWAVTVPALPGTRPVLLRKPEAPPPSREAERAVRIRDLIDEGAEQKHLLRTHLVEARLAEVAELVRLWTWMGDIVAGARKRGKASTSDEAELSDTEAGIARMYVSVLKRLSDPRTPGHLVVDLAQAKVNLTKLLTMSDAEYLTFQRDWEGGLRILNDYLRFLDGGRQQLAKQTWLQYYWAKFFQNRVAGGIALVAAIALGAFIGMTVYRAWPKRTAETAPSAPVLPPAPAAKAKTETAPAPPPKPQEPPPAEKPRPPEPAPAPPTPKPEEKQPEKPVEVPVVPPKPEPKPAEPVAKPPSKVEEPPAKPLSKPAEPKPKPPPKTEEATSTLPPGLKLVAETVICMKDGAEMVVVPAGTFTMGSGQGSPDGPAHEVHLDAFYMDKFEVTNAQFRAFIEAAAYPAPPHWHGRSVPRGHENRPVTNVSWNAAKEYAEWAGKRLPTEAEWEKAARGTDGRAYPWGNAWGARKCNTVENFLNRPAISVEDHRNWSGPWRISPAGRKIMSLGGATEPVGAFKGDVSPYGCYDMAGNVREWCADVYDKDYYVISPKRSPPGAAAGPLRSLRGASWFDRGDLGRCFARGASSPHIGDEIRGFRCAISATPAVLLEPAAK